MTSYFLKLISAKKILKLGGATGQPEEMIKTCYHASNPTFQLGFQNFEKHHADNGVPGENVMFNMFRAVQPSEVDVIHEWS